MNNLSDSIKSVIIVALVLVMGITSSMRLMEIQIVGGDDIVNPSNNDVSSFVYTRNTRATRGEIIDYSGNVLVGNISSVDLILQSALFPEDNQVGNDILLQIYNELKKRGYTVEMNIPISESIPYTFTSNDVEELKSDLNLNVYATAENCIDKLIADYEIAETYSDSEKRIIAGMRYELLLRDFSPNNDFILATDVDSDTVIAMKELSNVLRGVDAVESASREIVRGDVLPHEIGTVGPIYAEEYETLKDKGYSLNDSLGKSGIERAMETELRGQNGTEEITVQNNTITNIKTLTEAKSGYTVKLTINSTYQLRLQEILDNFIENFPNINNKSELKDVKCGAIVVLDAKTGALKAAATAPTYNLIDYTTDYETVINAENSPLVNRATDGLYRPGSTFKTITATAGLNEGIVTGEDTYNCTRKYHYIDTDYKCTGHHNDIAVTKALEVSCNIYFYELSQKLTIDNITKYAQLYGLGQNTGLETGDAAGYLANPETFSKNNQPWYIGYVLQAGIGNIDCGMTPLQMAVVANTIANDGIRYQPYLVDSLYEYGTSKLVSKTQPTIAEQIDLNYDYVYDYIEQGMIDASHNMPERYSLSNLGFDVAIKTGTPQNDSRVQDSFFIGYAPADNPEIAFAGVIEGGEYSKYMIRDIILAYQECYGLNNIQPNATLNTTTTIQTDADGNTVTTTTTTADAAATSPETAPDEGINSDEPSTQSPTETITEAPTDAPAEAPTEAEPATTPNTDVTMPPETPEASEPEPPTQSE